MDTKVKEVDEQKTKVFRVLVADDATTMRKFIKLALENNFPNIVVDEAVNGKEAQAMLQQLAYDLFLCDWEMPGVTGEEILRWVRAHPDPKLIKIPFIMVSSRADKESVLEAIKGGVNSYMVKPFNAQSLAQKIVAVLDRIDRRAHQRFDVGGAITLHFGDQAVRGTIIDFSMGGVFGSFGRTPAPTIVENVLVDVEIDSDNQKVSGLKGFVIRLQAAESFPDTSGIKTAVKFLDFAEGQRLEVERIIGLMARQGYIGD